MSTCFMLLYMVTLQQTFIMSYISKMGGDIHDYHRFFVWNKWMLARSSHKVVKGGAGYAKTRYLTYHNINTAVILL